MAEELPAGLMDVGEGFFVFGARCSECGEDVTAPEFSAGLYREWPVLVTEDVVREPMCHGEACEGRLLLQDVITFDAALEKKLRGQD